MRRSKPEGKPVKPKKTALILSGGGARAAYQVGVLKAVAEILPKSCDNPFPIICGTSAGALNAIALAAHRGTFKQSVENLTAIWQGLTIDKVYLNGWFDILKGLGRIGGSLFNQGVGSKPLSLLDNSPLGVFLENTVNFNNIEKRIESGRLHAVSVTAMSYTSGESISFFQGQPELKHWQRHRRSGVPADLTLQHLLASSAIPTIFPSVKVNNEYFGDGALRQLAPMSPALHLGADALFVVGVSGNRNPKHWGKQKPVKHSPSMGQIMGNLLSGAFIDALENDIERLERLNKLLHLIPPEQREAAKIGLRPVDNMVISPSEQLDIIAAKNVHHLPKSVRFFLRATGSKGKGGGAASASYLLFANAFINELIDLGYRDTMWEAENIEKFFVKE